LQGQLEGDLDPGSATCLRCVSERDLAVDSEIQRQGDLSAESHGQLPAGSEGDWRCDGQGGLRTGLQSDSQGEPEASFRAP